MRLHPCIAERRRHTGEVLRNLRSALDHLAWQLVPFDGDVPPKRTEFSITRSGDANVGLRLRSDHVVPSWYQTLR